jgi:hypothetical protein
MALRTPPSWLQNGSHPAENDRLSMQAIIASTGIIGTSSLAVTQNSPAGMSVLVAAGWGGILGTTQSNMGVYQFYNDASAVATITTANPSNPRIDRVCITVSDAYYTGALNQVAINVVAGTAAASPVAPSTPANSISLATIAVAAGATSILTANITDTRVNVTTNLPVGDLTEVAAGTGITVTSGTGPIPTVAIDSSVVTLTGTQTLTNKTLTTPIITSISNTGTITVPTGTDTLVGRATTDTLTNKTLTSPTSNTATINNALLKSPEERCTVSATAATGTIAFDTQTQGVLYYTTNASANFTLNFTNVAANLATGDSITCVFLNTNGATAYYPTVYQVDSTAVTPKWQGGTAPTSGNASSIDGYSVTIIKTAATPTYTVLASQTKFA